MAMEINSVYNNVYESAYAAQKQETVKKQAASNRESDTAKQTNDVKSAYETKTSTSQTTDEYLSALRKKYPNVNITVADFSNIAQRKSYMFGCSGCNNIAISSSILEKMASDPATAAKYEKTIAEVPDLGERFKKEIEAMGGEQIACGTVIDKTGKITYWGISKAKPVENPGTVYKEKVQKQLKEKHEEKIKQEKEEKNKKKEIQEKQQEIRMAKADSEEELLMKFRKGETEDVVADIVEQVSSKDDLGGNVDYFI